MDTPGTAEQGRGRRPAMPLLLVAALVVVTAAASATAAIYLTRGGSDSAEASAPDEPAAVTLYGTLDLDGDGSLTVSGSGQGAACQGHRGYSDIRPGAQVTVTDPAGQVLAIGQLDAGELTEPGALGRFDRFGVCQFRFEVDGVPTGHGLYGVEIASRGVVTYDEDRLGTALNGPSLTLG